jgi:hypothetical protein
LYLPVPEENPLTVEKIVRLLPIFSHRKKRNAFPGRKAKMRPHRIAHRRAALAAWAAMRCRRRPCGGTPAWIVAGAFGLRATVPRAAGAQRSVV